MTNDFQSRFSLQQVRTFVAVAELEHVTQAAARIRLSQGAVTQQIKLFEKAIGVRVFERTGRNVRLTDGGRAMLEACRAAVRAAERVEETARAMSSLQQGRVLVGASHTVASRYLSTPLAEFVAVHSRVEVEVGIATTSAIISDVAAGIVDCGLVAGRLGRSRLQRVQIAEDELVVVVAADHPLIGRPQPLMPAHLRTAHYIAREPFSETEDEARSILGRSYGSLPKIVMNQLEAVRSATLAGAGYSVLPLVAIEDELDAGRLVQLPIPGATRAIWAIRRPSLAGPALEAFWKALTTTR